MKPIGGAHVHRKRLERAAFAVANAEEIPDGAIHAGILFAIPVNAHQHFSGPVLIVAPYCEPDMIDAAGAIEVADDLGLPLLYWPRIGVAAFDIPARGPHPLAVSDVYKIGQGTADFALGKTSHSDSS